MKQINILPKKLKNLFIISYLFSVFSTVVQIFASLLILPFISNLFNQSNALSNIELFQWFNKYIFDINALNLMSLGLFVVFLQIFSSGISAYTNYHNQKIIIDINHYFSMRLLKYYMNKDILFYTDKNTGIITKSIIQDAQQMSHIIYQSYLNVLVNGTLIGLFLLMLLSVNIPITLFLIAFFLFLIIGLSILTKKKLMSLGYTSNRDNQLRSKYISEILNNLRIIKTYLMQDYFLEHFEKVSNDFVYKYQKSLFYAVLPRYITEGFTISSIIIVALIYQQFTGQLQFILPILSLYSVSLFRILPSLHKLSTAISSLIFSKSIESEVTEILEDKDTIENKQNNKLRFEKSLELVSVCFKYPSRLKNVLTDINFELKKNHIVGIVGESGAGKSTLMDIILNILNPSSGQILIDQVDIRNYNQDQYIEMFSYVSQETLILDGSISENIAIGLNDNEIDQKHLKEVIDFVQLDQFIFHDLPDGINTMVGEKGINLSGGQKQRLSLARALYRNPEILILDESTNALDKVTESLIFNLIYKLKEQNKSIIIISHKSKNLDRCDAIYKIEDSHLVQVK